MTFSRKHWHTSTTRPNYVPVYSACYFVLFAPQLLTFWRVLSHKSLGNSNSNVLKISLFRKVCNIIFFHRKNFLKHTKFQWTHCDTKYVIELWSFQWGVVDNTVVFLGVWRCVAGRVLSDISTNRITVIFRVNSTTHYTARNTGRPWRSTR